LREANNGLDDSNLVFDSWRNLPAALFDCCCSRSYRRDDVSQALTACHSNKAQSQFSTSFVSVGALGYDVQAPLL
jgi:hypothetical protein